MKSIRITRMTAVALAVLGLFVPSVAMGAPQNVTPNTVADVALGSGGLLQGRLVDESGAGLATQSVSVVYGGKVIAKSTTGPDGQFRISGLRGGSHMIQTAGTSSVCRLWTGNAAPPQANTSVLIIEPQVAVRGQGFDGCVGDGCSGGASPVGHFAGGIKRFVNARTLLIGAAIGGIIWAATDDDDRSDDQPSGSGS